MSIAVENTFDKYNIHHTSAMEGSVEIPQKNKKRITYDPAILSWESTQNM